MGALSTATRGRARGRFFDRPGDVHVQLRRRLLETPRWWPEPWWSYAGPVSAEDLLTDPREAVTRARDRGMLRLELDRPLSPTELVNFASAFGPVLPVPDGDALVTQATTDGQVLHLRQRPATGGRVGTGLLFSDEYLMLHTELSWLPLDHQPAWLLLHCVEPPEVDGGAQTVLVELEAAIEHLSSAHRDWLTLIGADKPGAPPVLSSMPPSWQMTFRDMDAAGFAWRATGTPVVEADANEALRALLTALYSAEPIGVHWTRHSLLVFDNRRFGHARTVRGQRCHPVRRYLLKATVGELADQAEP